MGTRKTTSEFIENSLKIHGSKYNYEKVNYINNKTKVEIICNTHGSFYQTPNDHTGNHGCRKCSEENMKNYNLKEAYSKINESFLLYLYVIEIYRDGEVFLKVGISKDTEQRFKNIKVKSNGIVKELLILPCTLKEATILEDYILKELKENYKKKFDKKFSGYSECLIYEAKDLIIKKIITFITEINNKSSLVGKILEYEYGN